MKVPYTYTVLRYVHDVTTGEFANVGVVVYSPEVRFLGAKCRKKYARLSHMFPGLKGTSLKTTLRQIEVAFTSLGKQISNELSFDTLPTSIERVVGRILPADDSSLQWGTVGSGLTSSPQKTLESLWERLVMRYDEKPDDHRRSDDDIWRTFKKELDAKKITEHLVPKTITSSDDEIEFPHTLKNGQWHCIEPVSLDLSNNESMKEKAIKWLGQMTSLRDGATDEFTVYFLVGGPSSGALSKGYHRAIKILEKAEGTRVIQEAEAVSFSRQISALIKAHN